MAVCAFQSASSNTRPCWCNTPAKLCPASLRQFEKSPFISLSSGDRYQQGPDADRHKLTKTNLEIAPLVRFQQKSKRAHRIIVWSTLADAKVCRMGQLAISRLAKDLAAKTQQSLGAFYARMILWQAIGRLAGEVTELDAALLVVEHFERVDPDAAAALDTLDAHSTQDSDAAHERRWSPTECGIATRAANGKLVRVIVNALSRVDVRIGNVQAIDVVDQHWTADRALQHDVGNLVERRLFIRFREAVTLVELDRDESCLPFWLNTLVARRIERAVDQLERVQSRARNQRLIVCARVGWKRRAASEIKTFETNGELRHHCVEFVL